MATSVEVIAWDITALQQRLYTSLDVEHYDKAWNALQSVELNKDICWYHYHELKRSKNGYLEKLSSESSEQEVIRAIRRAFGEHDEEYATFKLACEANMRALMRVLHSNSDLLITTVFFCLSLSGNENVIKFDSVLKQLDSRGNNCLASLLREFISGDDYQYLCDWCNYTKHWANVPSMITCSFGKAPEEMISWMFDSFTYKNSKHASIAVTPFLQREYDRQGKLIPQIIKEVDLLHQQLCLEKKLESN
ncbi:hypothetical protein [Marinomonas fungiae]|uniref:Uncharacterized protein n=1 Tax=Marinomonas fungiae TaxID=1137284 RepID=A0A0K6IK19_9GAMM|nr:hypothetical protein [Marinomonas fungiae]CUB03637.1 hypothetical protein Ga0061065_10468 [Marinomonas fungiae]